MGAACTSELPSELKNMPGGGKGTSQMRNALDFYICSQWQLENSNTCADLDLSACILDRQRHVTHRLWILSEEFGVYGVHGGEILHVGQEDVDLDDVVNAASGRIENG